MTPVIYIANLIDGTNSLPELNPWSLDDLTNIGQSLVETARRMPDAIAVACPKRGQPKRVSPGVSLAYDTITFKELEDSSNQIANGLVAAGVRPGMRVAMMVPPGIDFVRHVFAVYKTGAVSILIDPGMGRKNMIRCLSDAAPEGLVGIRKAHVARIVFRGKLKRCKINISTDGGFPFCDSSKQFLKKQPLEFSIPQGDREAEASIIFTTGSTGPPKGVLYRHRHFIEQSAQIRDYFQIQPGTVDVSGFPLFALFNTAMGTTTVFPEMDATRPAEIHPPNLIDAVAQFKADQSFGSPALWNTVSKFCHENKLTLPSIQRVLTAGAPVPPQVLESVKSIIHPEGDVFTPYGATESLPVACNSATMVLNETAAQTNLGKGTCVGNRFEKMEWRVIQISDDPLTSIEETSEVAQGEIGELMVRGPVVTDKYVTRTDANADHKVSDGETFWHRMGDVGYLDEADRFWFCGRKAHRVITTNETLFTVPCEAIINTHPAIYRSALVGTGPRGFQDPVIIVEPNPSDWPQTESDKEKLIRELQTLAAQHRTTSMVVTFLIREKLPVDIRHNSKIFREQLKPWAEEQLAHSFKA